MKFKSIEIYVSYGNHNSSMVMIEELADKKVNAWLVENPGVQIHHFAQSLADLNGSIVYQIGVFYSERQGKQN